MEFGNRLYELRKQKGLSQEELANRLDVTRQTALMPDVKPLAEGLKESYEWFQQHRDAVMRRPYMEYIDTNI